MNSNSIGFIIFKTLKNVLESFYYFSPSYYYYRIIEQKKEEYGERYIELKEIKSNISEVMKYYFFFIDLVIISFILSKNTFYILSQEETFNKIFYISITALVIFITFYCIYKIKDNISNKGNNNNENDLVDKIIKINGYSTENANSWYKKISNKIKIKIIELSLRKTIFLSISMIIIGLFTLKSKKMELFVSIILIYYFIMRPVHYYLVFNRDFRNKNRKIVVKTSDDKMRYITLALSNYVKIILEFCILIYTLKYMGWAFTNIEINTFFELVHLVVAGNLEATTSIEIFINLLRIATLGMVITLNLATYMALEVENKNIDNNMN